MKFWTGNLQTPSTQNTAYWLVQDSLQGRHKGASLELCSKVTRAYRLPFRVELSVHFLRNQGPVIILKYSLLLSPPAM